MKDVALYIEGISLDANLSWGAWMTGPAKTLTESILMGKLRAGR